VALWLVRANAATVAAASEQDAAVIAFSRLEDLDGVDSVEAVTARVHDAYPGRDAATLASWAAGIWSFVGEIRDGDLIAMPVSDDGPVRFGRVQGEYRYVPAAPAAARHQRPVTWLRDVAPDDLEAPLAAALNSAEREIPVSRVSNAAPTVAAADPAAETEKGGFGRRKFLVGALGAATAAAAAGVLRPWDSSSSSSHPAAAKAKRGSRSSRTPASSSNRSGSSIYANWVREENAKPGTSSWNLNNGGTNQIEGYANTVSAQRGDTLTMYVSTDAPTFTAQAFRMGYYQGQGGRLIWTSATLPGTRQALPSVTPGVNMVDAGWTPSFQLPITSQFPPGVYLVKLQGSDGFQHHIPFTVRDDSSNAAYLVQNSVTSWQAYNEWGGYSLYYGTQGRARDFAHRARIVSFDRPYDKGDGSSDFLGLEHPLIMLMEQMGLDVTYTTDVDVHQNPALLTNHRSFWSLGHDEYWSLAMRNGAEAARDAGVNLAFLGANAAFRQIRYEPSANGPNRHQVCYKSAAEDPMARVNGPLTTVNWRDAPVSRPESIMIGQQYESNPVNADLVFVDPSAWMFANTGIQAGTRIAVGVGSEYDRYYPSQAGPHNVQIVAHSPLVCNGRPSFADMTYYTALSGAGVFASGSIYWITKLSQPGPNSDNNPLAVAVTKNLLTAFGAGPAGERYPSVANYEQIAGSGTPTPPPVQASA
jgi:hypothetical protein